MNTTRLATLIMTSAFLFLYNCKKEEGEEVTEIKLPECELTIAGGQDEFIYGDTIPIHATLTKNAYYLQKMDLFLDGVLLTSKDEKEFAYELYTSKLEAGVHVLSLVAVDHLDRIGSDTNTFNLLEGKPVFKLSEVLRVGTDSATACGEFISSGGMPATWGVCYSTTDEPTVSDNKVEYEDSIFNIKLEGLQKLTNYYVRAWVTTASGTVYGNTVEFKTTDESGTFTDFRDDHVYRWVKIGEQVWMAENLAYLPFLSDPLNNPTKDSAIWVYGYAGMDVEDAKQTENYKEYGALYSFRMANKYCPTGWHLPDTNEWNELITFLGGENVAGGKMKERGTEHWKSPNTGATNESGFSAIGSGDFLPYLGLGNYLKERSLYWYSINSNSEEYVEEKYNLGYKNNNITISGFNIGKVYGRSVRCTKD